MPDIVYSTACSRCVTNQILLESGLSKSPWSVCLVVATCELESRGSLECPSYHMYISIDIASANSRMRLAP